MNAEDIQFSREGIRLQYLRFLSDTAPGILLAGFAALWFVFIPQFQSLPLPTKIVPLIVLALLATPLGLAINALTWFLLGFFGDHLEEYLLVKLSLKKGLWRFFPLRWLFIDPSNKVHQFDYATEYFDIKSSKQWLRATTTVGQLLEIHYPNQAAAMRYLQGLQIFLRSMAVVIPLGACLLSQGYLIPLDYLMPMGEEVNIPARQEVDLGGVFWGSVGGIGVLSFIGSVFVGFFLHARVLFEGYILCISRGLRDREHAGILRVLKEQRPKGN